VSYGAEGVAKALDHVERWRAAGATHVAINTMNAGLGPIDTHLDGLTKIAQELGLAAR
jgi:hypothetical protein